MHPKRRNDNLTREEAAIWRRIASYHGYLQRRGPGAGRDGSGVLLQLAIITGEVATVQIDHEELRPLIAWLREQATAQQGAILGETIASLADQLAQTLPDLPSDLSPVEAEAASTINTLEG